MNIYNDLTQNYQFWKSIFLYFLIILSNLGIIMRETGFLALMDNNGGITYFCKECVEKLIPHIQDIQTILKDKEHFMNWGSLCRLASMKKKYL